MESLSFHTLYVLKYIMVVKLRVVVAALNMLSIEFQKTKCFVSNLTIFDAREFYESTTMTFGQIKVSWVLFGILCLSILIVLWVEVNITVRVAQLRHKTLSLLNKFWICKCAFLLFFSVVLSLNFIFLLVLFRSIDKYGSRYFHALYFLP